MRNFNSYGLSGNSRRRLASVRVSGSVSDEREAASVGGRGSVSGPRHAERSRPRPTLSAGRAPHTNTPSPSPTRPACRDPRAGLAVAPKSPTPRKYAMVNHV